MSKVHSRQANGGNIGGTRIRAPYATQACDVCRRKKIRCNDQRPVCGPCQGSNRHQECSWTGENVRVPRTEAHFEALRKRVESLEEYVHILESQLDKCRNEHGGESNHLQFRPQEFSDSLAVDRDFDDAGSEAGSDIGQELSIATQNLKLEDQGLVLYGTAAPFRFATVPANSISRFPTIVENPTRRHVLLLDGVDPNECNLDLEWSRYLPVSPLLTRQDHDKLLDLLFKFFTCWCLRVVPDLFLRDMYRYLSVPRDQTPPKTTHYSPMLHNALMALATAFSDDPKLNHLDSRRKFADQAKAYIEIESARPNICVVQALSLIGSFHSSQGDENLGYLYFGMSTRVGQILGLSVDCSQWVSAGIITRDDMLDRNWAHWTSFTLDVCWSLYVGRDCSVILPTDGQSIPVPFVDSDFDQISWYYPPSNVPPQPNYLSRMFASTCELLVIVRRVMEVVNKLGNASSRQMVSDEVLTKLDLDLNSWKSKLSSELEITQANRQSALPHKLMMHLLYWLAFILLHRPFFHRRARQIFSSDKEIDHVKLCKRASDNIMDLLGIWQRLYGLRYVPVTLFQAIFSAGTIYLLLAVQAASGTRVAKNSLVNSLSQVEFCIKYLYEVGRSWQSAINIAEILTKLRDEQLKTLLQVDKTPGLDLNQQVPRKPERQDTLKPSPEQLYFDFVQPSSPAFSASSSSPSDLQPSSRQSLPVSSVGDAPQLDASGYTFNIEQPEVFSFDQSSTPNIPFTSPFHTMIFDNAYLQQQLDSFDFPSGTTPALGPEDLAYMEQLWAQTTPGYSTSVNM